MREILFRGKRLDGERWEEGSLFSAATGACKIIQALALHPDYVEDGESGGHIYYSEGWPVKSETVGQYTGLTDKNGVKIFEGDIVLDEKTGKKYEILYNYSGFMRADKHRFFYGITLGMNDDYEVIGNIYDNPELMEDKQC